MPFNFTPAQGEKIFTQDGSILGVVSCPIETSVILTLDGQKIAQLPAVLPECIVAWDIVPGVVNGAAVPVAGTSHQVPAGAVLFSSELLEADDDNPLPLAEFVIAVPPEGQEIDLDQAPELWHWNTTGNWNELAEFLPRGTKVLIVRFSRQWEPAGVLRDIEGSNDLPGMNGEIPLNQNFATGWWGCCTVHGPEEQACPVCLKEREQGEPVTWKAVIRATRYKRS